MSARSGGSYAVHPETGELTLIERTLPEAPPAEEPAKDPDAPAPAPGSPRRPSRPPQAAPVPASQE